MVTLNSEMLYFAFAQRFFHASPPHSIKTVQGFSANKGNQAFT